MKQKIIELAKKQKISDIGFCCMEDYIKASEKLYKAGAFQKEKTADALILDAKTIIVFAFNYYNGAEKGNISRYAMGEDYHKVTMRKMSPIVDFLTENGYKAKAFADIGCLNERILAKESGIAFLGRNQMAISEKFGSWFFIGYIVTDCPIEPDGPNLKTCLNCGKCVKACPLDALSCGFDEKKCLSYITQKRGELTETEKNAMFNVNTIWGCDICQEVCPHNYNTPITDIEEFTENLITNLDINSELSNKNFLKIYKNRAFSWRGKAVISRNLKIFKKN